MPILLEPNKRVTLDRMLGQLPVGTMQWSIVDAAGAMPKIGGLAPLSLAGPDELAFVSNPKYLSQVTQTQAGAVLLTEQAWASLQASNELVNKHTRWVVCDDPYLLYSKVAQWFVEQRDVLPHRIHPTAVIDPTAVIEHNVDVGPYVVIGQHSVIKAGTRIGAHTVIGNHVSIGLDSIIFPHVNLYDNIKTGDRFIIHSGAVIGADGFGFAQNRFDPNEVWSKIPQFGGVVFGHDVEVGANTSIDCGALEPTRIGNGVKLDNQIQIGHNTQIGDFTAMAGCCGIAGSAIIGSRCTFGGNAMIGGHLTIADGVHVSGGTVVISSIDTPGVYTGIFPVGDHKSWEKNAATLRQLSLLRRRIIALEASVKNT